MLYRVFFVWCLFLLSLNAQAIDTPEQRVLKALNVWQQGDADRAEKILSRLIVIEPEFRLAHLLRADILQSKARAINSPADGLKKSPEVEQLLLEVKSRWQAQHYDQLKNKIPAALIQPDIKSRYILSIDLQQSRLFVFANERGVPRLLHNYYISMGRGGAGKHQEGDLRTPLGVYFVQSFLPAIQLDDKYGAGAYPLNYPNAWDKFQQRTGSGIWLHGTRSGTYNRPPLASEGCVVLPNNDLEEVGAYIDIGQTPVIIGNGLQWLSKQQWQQQQAEYENLFQQWLADWQSLDVEKYLAHYSIHFRGDNTNYSRWVSHKRRVAENKKFIKVKARNLSIYKHPNEDVLVMTFQQDYRSDNFASSGWKRQYWHREDDGQWRIIFEGKVAAPMLAQRNLLQTAQRDIK